MTVTEEMPAWRGRRLAELAAYHEAPPVPEPLPEPEVRAVVVDADDPRVPRNARLFGAVAERAGWAVRVSYARGPVEVSPGRADRRIKIVDSIMVRCDRDQIVIAAYWQDGKAEYGALLKPGAVYRHLTVTEAKVALTSGLTVGA